VLIEEVLNTPLPKKPEENIKQMQKKFKRKKTLLKRNKSLPCISNLKDMAQYQFDL